MEPMCGKCLRKEPDKAFVSSVRLPGVLNDEADRRSEEPWLMGGGDSAFSEGLYMGITENSLGATEQRGSRSSVLVGLSATPSAHWPYGSSQ